MYSLLITLLLSNVSNAGSICNDGTYSDSEGRGTCSWHGGVATSGVYLDSQQSNSYRDQTGVVQRWEDSYDVTNDGTPFHDTSSVTSAHMFSYACFVLKDQSIGETIMIMFPFNVEAQSEWSVAPKENVKVFAHSKNGHALISGNWAWTTTSNGFVVLVKARGNLLTPFSADQLLPSDMTRILNADRLVVSIQGEKNVVIPIPDAVNKISSTWGKCKATI